MTLFQILQSFFTSITAFWANLLEVLRGLIGGGQ